MAEFRKQSATILGVCLIIGLAALGYLLGQAALQVKDRERTVTVKGLAEREVPADIVIWPIQFSVADNDLTALYREVEDQVAKIHTFLEEGEIRAEEISISPPLITDKIAQSYGQTAVDYRYTAVQTVTVYSREIARVREVTGSLSQLGRQGIALTGDEYQVKTEYLFTGLNDLKPQMIEEATRQAREVAQKFAEDSESRLGKIRRASQGQFSINDRDKNNPHIKIVRVVSTVEYYLSD